MITIRSIRPTDEAFIYSTYLKNNWHSPKNDTTLRKETWMRVQHGRLEGLFVNAPEEVKVACLSEDEDTILGYKLQQFTYIRPAWRKVAKIEELLK